MKVSEVARAGCPERAVLEHVTSTWGVLVLVQLAGAGTLRFSELRRRIGGVSEKMLAQTLRTLERDGFIRRRARPVIPPHVDYDLTALGVQVAEKVSALAEWTAQNVTAVTAAQQTYDAAS